MLERGQIVTSFVREQEEESRPAAAASQVKQGQWMNWHGVETRKISWRELGAMDANHTEIIVGDTYDVLPGFILCERGREEDTVHTVQEVLENGSFNYINKLAGNLAGLFFHEQQQLFSHNSIHLYK